MGFSLFGNLQNTITLIQDNTIDANKKESLLSVQEDEKHGAPGYHVAIVGGGLAGLALSIQLAKQGYRVIVFEKEQYPHHKVCGEYVSMEAWDFLHSLGLDLKSMDVSEITRLQVSAINGKLLEQELPLGGFGISRYELEYGLVKIARAAGARIEENAKVNEISFDQTGFVIKTSRYTCSAAVTCGSYGKRSNIDVRWDRPFVKAARNKLNNFIGVKYHIRIKFPPDTIALHNFRNGYCGIVKIEAGKYCLCYLTTADNLQQCKGSIPAMEQTILRQNPHLKKILDELEMLYETPVTISQISFDKKSQVDNHVLMVGDAAGMITPLCGNGMSMALHGSKIAAEQIHRFLQGLVGREEMEQQYTKQWQQQFAQRLKMGRRIQRLFGREWITSSFISIAKHFPRLVNFLIKKTHGKSF